MLIGLMFGKDIYFPYLEKLGGIADLKHKLFSLFCYMNFIFAPKYVLWPMLLRPQWGQGPTYLVHSDLKHL